MFRKSDEVYIDKSLLIKDLIDEEPLILQINRPPGFGKSLNISMIRYFFHSEC